MTQEQAEAWWAKMEFVGDFVRHYIGMDKEAAWNDIQESMAAMLQLDGEGDSFGSKMVRKAKERMNGKAALASAENGKLGGRPAKKDKAAGGYTREDSQDVTNAATPEGVSTGGALLESETPAATINGTDAANRKDAVDHLGLRPSVPTFEALDAYKGESNTGSTVPEVRPESGTIEGDAATREGAEAFTCRESGATAPTTVSTNMRRVPQNEAPAHGFSGGRTAQGTMSRSPEAAAQSGKDYDQATVSTTTISTNGPRQAPSHGGSVANISGTAGGSAKPEAAGGESSSKDSDKSSLPADKKYPNGEFKNVMLTVEESAKLCIKFGPEAVAMIEELSQYLASSPKAKYKSHYATLLTWQRRKAKEEEPKRRFKTTEEISQENYEISKRRLDAYFAAKEKKAV